MPDVVSFGGWGVGAQKKPNVRNVSVCTSRARNGWAPGILRSLLQENSVPTKFLVLARYSSANFIFYGRGDFSEL